MSKIEVKGKEPLKTCNRCRKEKPLHDFNKQVHGKFGRKGRCKSCCNLYTKKYYQENSERLKEYSKLYRKENPNYQKEYYKNNREKVLSSWSEYYFKNKSKIQTRTKKWREANKERLLKQEELYRSNNRNKARDYYQRNKDYFLQSNKQRKARKLSATPPWLTQEHVNQMRQFYYFRGNISGVVGREYHVDHIVPLQGENVCGLHVPWNLQVIPAKDNLSKGNFYNDW